MLPPFVFQLMLLFLGACGLEGRYSAWSELVTIFTVYVFNLHIIVLIIIQDEQD